MRKGCIAIVHILPQFLGAPHSLSQSLTVSHSLSAKYGISVMTSIGSSHTWASSASCAARTACAGKRCGQTTFHCMVKWMARTRALKRIGCCTEYVRWSLCLRHLEDVMLRFRHRQRCTLGSTGPIIFCHERMASTLESTRSTADPLPSQRQC